jgi:hypothetical protein
MTRNSSVRATRGTTQVPCHPQERPCPSTPSMSPAGAWGIVGRTGPGVVGTATGRLPPQTRCPTPAGTHRQPRWRMPRRLARCAICCPICAKCCRKHCASWGSVATAAISSCASRNRRFASYSAPTSRRKASRVVHIIMVVRPFVVIYPAYHAVRLHSLASTLPSKRPKSAPKARHHDSPTPMSPRLRPRSSTSVSKQPGQCAYAIWPMRGRATPSHNRGSTCAL